MNNLNDIFLAPAASDNLTCSQILEDVQRRAEKNHASTIAERARKTPTNLRFKTDGDVSQATSTRLTDC